MKYFIKLGMWNLNSRSTEWAPGSNFPEKEKGLKIFFI